MVCVVVMALLTEHATVMETSKTSAVCVGGPAFLKETVTVMETS